MQQGDSSAKGSSVRNADSLFLVLNSQAIPGELPNTILTNTYVVGSNGERMSLLMFHVPRGFMERFSGGFLISISLPATDLECLIRNLIFNSLKFK